MLNTYVQFNKETGLYEGTVQCSEFQALEQFRNNDINLLKVPSNPLETGLEDGVPYARLNWDIIRAAIAEDIDAAAEKFCLSFITPGVTQAARYARKEAEARAWLVDNNSPIPLVQAEADALGVDVGSLITQIIAKADEWILVMAIVESKRLAAKQALAGLTNIGEMVAVTQINWLENEND